MKNLLISLVMVLMGMHQLASQQQNECAVQSLCDTTGIIAENIGNDRILMVINTEDADGAHWYLIEPFHNTFLGADIGVMTAVDQIMVSKDNKYLAVKSVGEGHPVLNIIDLNQFLEHKKFKSLYEIDPYPGYIINIEKWEEDNLLIESDALLSHSKDEFGHVPRCLLFSEAEKFTVSMTKGSIKPISENAKNPFPYFSKILNAENPYERMDAACALEVLGDKTVIPILEKALKQEKDKEVIAEIIKAIAALKK